MKFKSLAVLFAALSFAAVTPSASAWYAYTTNVAVVDSNYVTVPGQWTFHYALTNNTNCFGQCSGTVQGKSISEYLLGVHTFSIPFFDDAGIVDINAPAGWTYSILAADTFNLGYGAGTLQWSTTDESAFIARDESLGGFSYNTVYAPGKGPFSAQFGNSSEYIGDPAVPLSPNAILAGIGQPAQVPEPATGLLMLAAAGALVARRRFARSAK